MLRPMPVAPTRAKGQGRTGPSCLPSPVWPATYGPGAVTRRPRAAWTSGGYQQTKPPAKTAPGAAIRGAKTA